MLLHVPNQRYKRLKIKNGQNDRFGKSSVKDNINEWVTFACDGTGPADESKRTKRVQGWSRSNWLDGILITVTLHIHFNKLLMPLLLVCCFTN